MYRSESPYRLLTVQTLVEGIVQHLLKMGVLSTIYTDAYSHYFEMFKHLPLEKRKAEAQKRAMSYCISSKNGDSQYVFSP